MSIYIISIAIIAITSIIVVIIEVGKSKRIDKFKNIDDSKIKSIGEYEKNSKTNKPSIFLTKPKLDNP